jgi:hypothetical protein
MSENFKPSNSFEIENSKGFFAILCDEYADFDKEHLNPRYAINCAITSWHLTDWTYQEFFKTDSRFQDSREDKKTISGLSKYQEFLKTKCSELEYMRMITNGLKHCKINQQYHTVISSGDFSPYDFHRNDFLVPRFIIINDNDDELDFENLFLKTKNFWKTFLDELYNPAKRTPDRSDIHNR